MEDKETIKEHKNRIGAVVDYIVKNIDDDVSLQTLAGVANYSPFHLQKLFKQLTGESPKQYVIKIRLETALLLMIIHPYKSIKEIAIDAGFSSPSVFSRAIKNYFGISPEDIRMYSPKDRMQVFKSKRFIAAHLTGIDAKDAIDKLDIQIKKIETITGFYLVAPCDNMGKIQECFKELMQIADTNDLTLNSAKMYGILNPHQGNMYKTFMVMNKHQRLPANFNRTEIKAGKYATFKIKGDIEEGINAGHYLYHNWLPENGYKIADIVRFEIFSGNPATTPYNELQREFYMPIQPI